MNCGWTLKDLMVRRPARVSEKWEKTGALLRLSNLWSSLEEHLYREDSEGRRRRGGRPVEVLDPPVDRHDGEDAHQEERTLKQSDSGDGRGGRE